MPKNPGDDGTATPSAMTPCRKSAALNGASMPTALNPNQNDNAFMSQNAIAQPKIVTNRRGLRSTLSPSAVRPWVSSRGARRRTTISKTRISHAGKNTIV